MKLDTFHQFRTCFLTSDRPALCRTFIICTFFLHFVVTFRPTGNQGYVAYPYGIPSLVIPQPCQANALQEKVNYICAHGRIWCLPGWKVSDRGYIFEFLSFYVSDHQLCNVSKMHTIYITE